MSNEESGTVTTQPAPGQAQDNVIKFKDETETAINRVQNTALSINDIISFDQKIFNERIRECVIMGMAKYGQWIDYVRLKASVRGELKSQFDKKIHRAVRDNFIAEGYWKNKSGMTRKIICLLEKDPQFQVAVKVFREGQKQKLDSEIKKELPLLERRQQEIEAAYNQITKTPELVEQEIIRIENLIIKLIDERDRLRKLTTEQRIQRAQKQETKRIDNYVSRLEATIAKMEGLRIKDMPPPESEAAPAGDLQAELNKIAGSYLKPELRSSIGPEILKKVGFMAKARKFLGV